MVEGASPQDPREPVSRLLRDLRTQAGGLTSREAARRLVAYGPNELRRRGGRRWPRYVEAQTLVPGDVLLIAEGNPISADSRLLEGAIDVDMSTLTGESQAVFPAELRWHGAYLEATTMTFAGIVACQIGTALAARTERASLRAVGFFSNWLLLWAILSEIVFAAALIYVPALQRVFGTASLQATDLVLLLVFPVVVWGVDEVRRARVGGEHLPEAALAGRRTVHRR